MTPKNPQDLLQATVMLDKAFRRNAKSKAAMKKMARKLKAVRRAKDITEIRVLLGMARVALDKAEFIARTGERK
jgi:hypothetical protein